MADNISIDFSEFSLLAADLGRVPDIARPNMRKAVAVTSRKVMLTWREKLKGDRHLPRLPYSVTFDVSGGVSLTSAIRGEIGFDRSRKQGKLGTISEFGALSQNTQPRGFGLRSLQENIEDFRQGLSIAVRDAERQAGL